MGNPRESAKIYLRNRKINACPFVKLMDTNIYNDLATIPAVTHIDLDVSDEEGLWIAKIVNLDGVRLSDFVDGMASM